MKKDKKFIKKLKFRYKVIRLKLKYLFRRRSNPIYNYGVHFIEGSAGSGKTLLANIMLQNTVSDNTFFYSNINQFDNNKTKTVDFFSMFENGKQIKKLPKKIHDRYCAGLIIDELNANFNRRLNNRKDYNDVFIGLMQFSVTHRHQGIPKIYFLGQSLQLQDGQVMQIFKYRHIVKSSRRYSFDKYLHTKDIEKLPKKLRVDHYIKSDNLDNSGAPVFIKFKTTKIKVDYNKHIRSYNHLGYANQFKVLPDMQV